MGVVGTTTRLCRCDGQRKRRRKCGCSSRKASRPWRGASLGCGTRDEPAQRRDPPSLAHPGVWRGRRPVANCTTFLYSEWSPEPGHSIEYLLVRLRAPRTSLPGLECPTPGGHEGSWPRLPLCPARQTAKRRRRCGAAARVVPASPPGQTHIQVRGVVCLGQPGAPLLCLHPRIERPPPCPGRAPAHVFVAAVAAQDGRAEWRRRVVAAGLPGAAALSRPVPACAGGCCCTVRHCKRCRSVGRIGLSARKRPREGRPHLALGGSPGRSAGRHLA